MSQYRELIEKLAGPRPEVEVVVVCFGDKPAPPIYPGRCKFCVPENRKQADGRVYLAQVVRDTRPGERKGVLVCRPLAVVEVWMEEYKFKNSFAAQSAAAWLTGPSGKWWNDGFPSTGIFYHEFIEGEPEGSKGDRQVPIPHSWRKANERYYYIRVQGRLRVGLSDLRGEKFVEFFSCDISEECGNENPVMNYRDAKKAFGDLNGSNAIRAARLSVAQESGQMAGFLVSDVLRSTGLPRGYSVLLSALLKLGE